MRIATLLPCLLLTACSLGEPLGDDWKELDEPARTERALEALEALFAAGVDGGGAQVVDRVVLSRDAEGIRYKTLEDTASELRWKDIESVENQAHNDVPSRPESLYLYLASDSPSSRQVKDLVSPPLSSTGLVRSYVLLRSRPRWSRNKVIAALDHLEKVQTPDPEPAPAPAETPAEAEPEPEAQTASEPEPTAQEKEVEAKLRTLKRWHDEGLIDDAEYETKRKALLEEF